nr:unnamed protein product [Callosobruchus analis]
MRSSIGHLPFLWAIVFGTIANQIYNSLGVSDTLYGLNWYTGSIWETKLIRFMIARSQIPATLPATPFGCYRYSLFVTVMIFLSPYFEFT